MRIAQRQYGMQDPRRSLGPKMLLQKNRSRNGAPFVRNRQSEKINSDIQNTPVPQTFRSAVRACLYLCRLTQKTSQQKDLPKTRRGKRIAPLQHVNKNFRRGRFGSLKKCRGCTEPTACLQQRKKHWLSWRRGSTSIREIFSCRSDGMRAHTLRLPWQRRQVPTENTSR